MDAFTEPGKTIFTNGLALSAKGRRTMVVGGFPRSPIPAGSGEAVLTDRPPVDTFPRVALAGRPLAGHGRRA